MLAHATIMAAALAFSPSSLEPPRHAAPPHVRRAALHASAASVEVAPFPSGPKDVATQMSLAVQAALAAGETQLALTLPADMRFGIFGDPGKLTIGNPTGPPSAAVQQRAEFELAFLCAEMFRGECTCVLESPQACKAAEREFGAKGMRPRFVPSIKRPESTSSARTESRKREYSTADGAGGRPRVNMADTLETSELASSTKSPTRRKRPSRSQRSAMKSFSNAPGLPFWRP